MTHLLVLYDISDDRLRAKVADACLDYGLERVQYSAFVGELGRAHQRELEVRMRELVGRHSANIRLIPLDVVTWRRQRIIRREGAGGSAEERSDELSGVAARVGEQDVQDMQDVRGKREWE